MKKSILFLAFALLMGAVLSSCTSADEKISKELATVLATYTEAKVDVKDGVVTLSGEAIDSSTKTKIEELVKGVGGIKSVVNNLDVKPQIVINADETITAGISTALASAGFKSVNAVVQDGVVTLTGDLKRTDLIKVMQAVNSTSPKKVNNQLTIK